MLEHINIKNFKSLVRVEAPLRPLTVLIGKNDSGKTSFLKALLALADGRSFSIEDYYLNDQKRSIEIEGLTTDNGIVWNKTSVGTRPDSSLKPALRYQLPAQGVSMSSPGYDDRQGPQPLDESGSGVPSLIDYLLRRDRTRFFELVDEVRRLVPGVADIGIETPEPSRRALNLILEHEFRMPGDQASSGVRLLLFFISLAFHPDPPKLILVEEPETGIHPKRLSEVIRLLRGITEGAHGGHAAQVVLSTHSPYLLDCLDIEKDQVLVFRREEDGRRTVEPADAERLKLFLDEFMLGEVWYNQGEEGLVADHAASLRG